MGSPEHDEPGQSSAARPDPELMAQRYGTSGGRRTGIIAAVVAVLVAVAWLAWEVASLGENSVTAENLAVTVVDPGRTDISFTIVTDPGTTVSCTLSTVNAVRAEVGVREVMIGPVTERVTTVTEPVTTVEEAAAGEVEGCEIVDE